MTAGSNPPLTFPAWRRCSAPAFRHNGYRPRRSMMFISFGAEEAGVEATESDWLAGSDAFAKQHPEITRRLALGVNIDVTGWGGDRGNYMTTPDSVAFAQTIVKDAGLSDRMSVSPIPSSTTDAWNLSSVGGGTVALIQWTNGNGGVFGRRIRRLPPISTSSSPEFFPNRKRPPDRGAPSAAVDRAVALRR